MVVPGSSFNQEHFPASNVLILGREDRGYNYWLAEYQKTEGQGFTLKLDDCARMIAGCQIKNKGKGGNPHWATKGFKISGSKMKTGPWETLVEDEMVDTRGKPADLLNFTFEKPVEIQFIKFELVSYWGEDGGGLQYFAATEVTSKYWPGWQKLTAFCRACICKISRQKCNFCKKKL